MKFSAFLFSLPIFHNFQQPLPFPSWKYQVDRDFTAARCNSFLLLFPHSILISFISSPCPILPVLFFLVQVRKPTPF